MLKGKVKGWFHDLPAGQRAELAQRWETLGPVGEQARTFIVDRVRSIASAGLNRGALANANDWRISRLAPSANTIANPDAMRLR